MVYNYFRDYDSVTGRYVQSDPVGLYGGTNSYAYARGRPTNNADPLGLFTVTASFYEGVGGTVTVAYENGTVEVTSKLGMGWGGGLSWSLSGGPTPHAKSNGQGYIYRTSLDGGVALGKGRLGIGASFKAITPNLLDDAHGPNYWLFDFGELGSADGPRGGSISLSYGVEAGSYFQWPWADYVPGPGEYPPLDLRLSCPAPSF